MAKARHSPQGVAERRFGGSTTEEKPQGGSEEDPRGGRKVEPRTVGHRKVAGRGGGKVPDRRLCKSRLASLEPGGLRRAGVVRHGSRYRLQQTATGVAPRSADGFGRTVTRGCVASGRV